MLKAVDRGLAPENAADLPGLLIRHLPHLSLSVDAARRAGSAGSILKPGLPVNRDGLQVVLDLPRKYGTPPAEIDDPEKYLDLGYAEAAMAGAIPR